MVTTYKSDIGDYRYNDSKPHAFVSSNSNCPVGAMCKVIPSHQYDANGNMTRNDDKQIAWT